MTAVYALLMRK